MKRNEIKTLREKLKKAEEIEHEIKHIEDRIQRIKDSSEIVFGDNSGNWKEDISLGSAYDYKRKLCFNMKQFAINAYQDKMKEFLKELGEL